MPYRLLCSDEFHCFDVQSEVGERPQPQRVKRSVPGKKAVVCGRGTCDVETEQLAEAQKAIST